MAPFPRKQLLTPSPRQLTTLAAERNVKGLLCQNQKFLRRATQRMTRASARRKVFFPPRSEEEKRPFLRRGRKERSGFNCGCASSSSSSSSLPRALQKGAAAGNITSGLEIRSLSLAKMNGRKARKMNEPPRSLSVLPSPSPAQGEEQEGGQPTNGLKLGGREKATKKGPRSVKSNALPAGLTLL